MFIHMDQTQSRKPGPSFGLHCTQKKSMSTSNVNSASDKKANKKEKGSSSETALKFWTP
jgi:hypothetical protein